MNERADQRPALLSRTRGARRRRVPDDEHDHNTPPSRGLDPGQLRWEVENRIAAAAVAAAQARQGRAELERTENGKAAVKYDAMRTPTDAVNSVAH